MLESPFAFLRGSATVMAADLAGTPVSGIDAILCGDAHLSNFGVFATPERQLVFDINDFDEVYPGPWEWDLKRLAASAVVAGRANGFKEKKCHQLAVVVSQYYRKAMQRFAENRIMDVWYYHIEVETVLDVFDKYSKQGAESAKKMVKKARRKTHAQTMEKLTEYVDGRRQIINDPPLLVRLSDLLTDEQKDQVTKQDIEKAWSDYISSLPEERRALLSRFRIADGALRVGGVGSVGTRCWIILLEGTSEDDALILQQKEAGRSVLETHLSKIDYASPAQRVVVGQRLMQAASDIFLGWHQSTHSGTHYYWRQLKDMKGSVDVATLDETGLAAYLGVCSVCLARAHARTSHPAMITGYLGTGEVFDKAISSFAVAYADQTERDYQALEQAVKSGRLPAEKGI
ncbi:MAG: DUF2252 domain-containing protein [Anaerolineales bacterium]|nr:DUF2252 domain-containing protein [Anaerolineales bacterium]